MRVGGGSFVENLTAGANRLVVQDVKGVNIAIDVGGTGTVRLSNISVWNPAKPFSFDMFDERKVWMRKAVTTETPDTEDAAVFMPHVRDGEPGPNWAGVIRAGSSTQSNSGGFEGATLDHKVDDRLYSEALATPTAGVGRVRICFDHRLLKGLASSRGGARLAMSGLAGGDHEFSSSTIWATSCTTTRRGSLKTLEFRALPSSTGANAILIDNVRLTWIPSPVSNLPMGPNSH